MVGHVLWEKVIDSARVKVVLTDGQELFTVVVPGCKGNYFHRQLLRFTSQIPAARRSVKILCLVVPVAAMAVFEPFLKSSECQSTNNQRRMEADVNVPALLGLVVWL